MALLENESRENRRKTSSTEVVLTRFDLTELPVCEDASKFVIKMNEDCQEPVEKPVNNEVEGTLHEAARRERRFGLRQCYPVIWIGNLFLKTFEVRIEIRFMYGDLDVAKNALHTSTGSYPGIHLRKKLKFDPFSQEYVKEKFQPKQGSCVVIALPLEFTETQWQCLQNQFIHYFNKKKIIGISEHPQDGKSETKYEMLMVPPRMFLRLNLSPMAPRLTALLYKHQIPHLMIVIS